MSESYDDAEIIDVFIQESQEHLESIEPALISLEDEGADTDKETINLIFRAIHSIKGSAGFFGFNNISGLSHVMENMMVMVRDKTLVPTQEVVEALLKGLDKINLMIDDISNSEDVDVSEERQVIEAILSKDEGSGDNAKDNGKAVDETVLSATSSPVEEKAGACAEGSDLPDDSGFVKWNLDGVEGLRESLETSRRRGQFTFTVKSVAGSNEALLAYKKNLESIGGIHATNPDIFSDDGVTSGLIEEGADFYVLFSSILEADMLIEFLGVSESDIEEFELELDSEELQATDAPVPVPVKEENITKDEKVEAKDSVKKKISKPAGGGEKHRSSSDTIRIRVELLDQIMALAGEIVLGRNRLLMQFANISDTTVISTHSQRVTELQEIIMKMRLQPVGTVFAKFRRIVRDMAVKVGKDINLVLEGEEVELDRSIIDGLTDPLTHIIRNSADHGLETTEERLANGKSAAGTITLSASHEGGHVIITAKDDGRGIDAEKIKKSAIKKELITSEEAALLNDREAVKLVFHPGFSTAAEVSDISGRGVGMDVVRSTFDKLGGTVELETAVDKGSSIIVRLPLTLTIMHSLIVGCEGFRFAIPQVDLVEVVRLKRGDRHRTELVQGREVLRLRGELLPVVCLADILGMKKHYLENDDDKELLDRRKRLSDRRGGQSPEEEAEYQASRDGDDCRRKKDDIKRLVVLRHNGNLFGLMVDAIYDPEEIVLKPLAGLVKNCEVFSGSTIMGDGSVAMILNITGIVDKSGFILDDLENTAKRFEDEEDDLNKKNDETLLVFKNSDTETFCMPFSGISRVERVNSNAIETVGSKEFVRIREEPVSLLRLENYFNVGAADSSNKTIYVIFPKGIKEPTGIVTTQIVDVIDRGDKRVGRSNESGGEETILIDENMVYRLDLPDLLRAAGVVH